MSNQTIQNSIDYALTFIQYSPMVNGTNNEPAITTANVIQNMILSAPFTWPWNRAENSTLTTQPGVQDYTVNILDFSYLEKVSLTDSTGTVFECKDVYNNLARGVADANQLKQARPQACGVLLVSYGAFIKIRFMGVPDKAYKVTLTYQQLQGPISALTGTGGVWAIPPQYSEIYNELFLGEAMALVDDARANERRQRGVTALLSKQEGLTEMQINAFLEQFWARFSQTQFRNGTATQAVQARGV